MDPHDQQTKAEAVQAMNELVDTIVDSFVKAPDNEVSERKLFNTERKLSTTEAISGVVLTPPAKIYTTSGNLGEEDGALALNYDQVVVPGSLVADQIIVGGIDISALVSTLTCDTEPAIEGMVSGCAFTLSGSNCAISCGEGWAPSGVAMCSSGSWEEPLPACEACPSGTYEENDECNTAPSGMQCPGGTTLSGCEEVSVSQSSAEAYCNAMSGWYIAYTDSARGSLYCLEDGVITTNSCNNCNTYRILVWMDGGGESKHDPNSYPFHTTAGNVYSSHTNPCATGPSTLGSPCDTFP